MTLSFEATEPKATWVFVNKDTGTLEVPGDSNARTTIKGIKGRLTELSVRVQTYDNPSYQDTKKLLMVFECGGEKVIVQTGLQTYLSKWFIYLVLNDRFEFTKEISLFTSKKEGIPVVVGRIYQDGMTKDIDPTVRKTFPKIDNKKQSKIDWDTVLGNSDMELIVTHANNHLQSFNQPTDVYVETVTLDLDPVPNPETEPLSSATEDAKDKGERLLDIPF